MRNFIKIIIAGGLFIALFFLFKSFYADQKITLKDDKASWRVKLNGLQGARDFTVDEKGNFYIAFMDKVQFIDTNGKSYNLIKDKTLNITSIEYKQNILYYSSGNKVLCYDLSKGEQKTLINDLPNYGDYKDSLLKINGEQLFISIGAATNSGVVGPDNQWIIQSPYTYDLSPKDITLKGKNFGNEKTGAFVPYKTKSLTGQLIPGHFPGNASVIAYNLSNGTSETFAWGIRNIKGMDITSDGKLMAVVGGMEDRGLRPVKGDVDYIYEIKKGLWYGWPDYSGGDPLTSPRFKGDNSNKLSFILDNHPTTNPPAPIFQHKYLSSLEYLAIDTKGVVGDKESIYFYDKRDNIVYALSKSGGLTEKAVLKNNSSVSDIKIVGNSLLIMDSSHGIMYDLHEGKLGRSFNLQQNIIYYLIFVALVGMGIGIWKFNYINNKK